MSKTYEMKDILEKLTGNICAYGDTNIDNNAIENIDEIEEFLVNKVNQLCTNARLSFRQEDSIKRVAQRSNESIERIKNILDYFETKESDIPASDELATIKREYELLEKLYEHTCKEFRRVVEELLGKDYYNLGMDQYSCTTMMADDIIEKYGKKRGRK